MSTLSIFLLQYDTGIFNNKYIIKTTQHATNFQLTARPQQHHGPQSITCRPKPHIIKLNHSKQIRNKNDAVLNRVKSINEK